MAIPLKYATASQEIPLGHFLDSSDGDTEETGLTIANTDIKLWKAGATTLANKNSGGATHISNGIYYCTLDATDTNTYGPLIIFVHVSGALAVKIECWVMEADAYDALFAAAGTGHIEADAVQISGDATAADNLESACDNYSATRGLSGTALPAAAAGGAGGLPTDSTGKTAFNDLSAAQVNAEVDTALSDIKLDHLVATAESDDPVDNSIIAKLAASDGDWSGFDASTDSLEAIRDRGDAAWTTGGGGSISDILNVQALIPNDIDLANTATVRIALGLTNMVDDLPTTTEISPGTITIDRKAIGGTSWTNVVNAAACSEVDGLIYYDEVFDTGTGYAEGDSIRITFKSQKITVAANDYEITGTDGWVFQTSIRQTMRGTNSAALASVCTEGRLSELDAANIPTDLSNIEGDTQDLQTQVGTAGAGLTDLGGMSTTMKGEVNAEVDTALNTAIPGSPTADSINERVKAIDDKLPSSDYLKGTADADGGMDANDKADVNAEADTALSDYDPPTKAEMDTAHALLATPAQVNAQVLDVLNTDTFAEPGQEDPPATTTLIKKIGYLYKSWRNKKDNDGSNTQLYADDGSTVDQKQSTSESGGTVTKGEWATGP